MNPPTPTLPIPVAPLSFHAPASPSRVPQTPATWGPHTVLRGVYTHPSRQGAASSALSAAHAQEGGSAPMLSGPGGWRGGEPQGAGHRAVSRSPARSRASARHEQIKPLLRGPGGVVPALSTAGETMERPAPPVTFWIQLT